MKLKQNQNINLLVIPKYQKIFKRFYSNRPENFGEHSGLGLNIVKNLVDLHEGSIKAKNRDNKAGAIITITFPEI